jgi:hypothetical protein
MLYNILFLIRVFYFVFGIDGLTVEFYRTFWPFLKHFAVKVFNNCYVKEELSNTQKIGLISHSKESKAFEKSRKRIAPSTLNLSA